MTIYILGGGPTGMAVAQGLMDSGNYDFVVFESNSQFGGLATTINWEGVGLHDLGPHKLFTLDDTLMNRVKNLLPPDKWITRKKVSSIFMGGKFLPYPPSPLSLIGIYGPLKFLRMSFGFLIAKITLPFRKKPISFEEDLMGRVGSQLYQILFEPIAKKIWGNPKELSLKLSEGRIQTPSIIEILSNLLGRRKQSKFEALSFEYPKGGLIELWDAIHSSGKEFNFRSNVRVSNIEIKDKKIKSFEVKTSVGIEEIVLSHDDFVVSTLPITQTYGMVATYMEENLLDTAVESIVLNDLALVFFHVDSSELFSESWIFVPDPEIIFHRVSEQNSFDPAMVKLGSIVCAEVMLTGEKERYLNLKDVLISECEKDLKKLTKMDFSILAYKVIVLKNSYPVYKVGFEKSLEKLISQLDSIDNFKTVGRQGSYNYIGTLDAMDIGFGFTRWYNDLKLNWESERIRTSNYPVLD
jgi:protoporphyrinogen oxidase